MLIIELFVLLEERGGRERSHREMLYWVTYVNSIAAFYSNFSLKTLAGEHLHVDQELVRFPSLGWFTSLVQAIFTRVDVQICNQWWSLQIGAWRSDTSSVAALHLSSDYQ